MKNYIFAAAFLCGSTGLATATEMVDDVVVAEPRQRWSGVYVGVHGGYQWQHHKTMFSGTDTSIVGVWSLFQDGLLVGASDAPDGAMIGFQAGYNYQVNSMVFGVEADISYVDVDAANSHDVEINRARFVSESTREMEYFGTLRGKVGFVPTARLLLFATGGLAFGNSKSAYSVDIADSVAPLSVAATDKATVGYTVGVGAEYALDSRWSIKAEYLYYDLGDSSWTILDQYLNQTSTLRGNTRNDGSVVRVGLNFRFAD